jgi:hypothetical protein
MLDAERLTNAPQVCKKGVVALTAGRRESAALGRFYRPPLVQQSRFALIKIVELRFAKVRFAPLRFAR